MSSPLEIDNLLTLSRNLVLAQNASEIQDSLSLSQLVADFHLIEKQLKIANTKLAALNLDNIIQKLTLLIDNKQFLDISLTATPDHKTPVKQHSMSILPTPAKPISLKQTAPKSAFIEPISIYEFESLPKYLIGRLSMQQTNEYIEALNTTIASLKKAISVPVHKMGLSQRDDMLDYKAIAETRDAQQGTGVYIRQKDFIGKGALVPSGLKGGFKLDSGGRIALGVVKHLGRVKEGRSAKSGAFYVLMD